MCSLFLNLALVSTRKNMKRELDRRTIFYLIIDHMQSIPSSELDMRMEPSSEKAMHFKHLSWAAHALSNRPVETCNLPLQELEWDNIILSHA